MQQLPSKSDIVIIGGGVIGAFCAYYLTLSGHEVTLIEKGEICAGSSHGNAGWIAADHAIPSAAPGVMAQGLKWMLDSSSPFYIKPRLNLDLARWLWHFQRACTKPAMLKGVPVLADLGNRSLALYDGLSSDQGFDLAYQRQGLLHLYLDAKSLQHGQEEADLVGQSGIVSQTLDLDGVRQLEAAVSDQVYGGIHYPEVAHVQPDHMVRAIANAAAKQGAKIITQTEVLAIECHGHKVTALDTTRGQILADQVIVAAGSWSPQLTRSIGVKLLIEPAKGYSITAIRPEGRPSRPLVLTEHRVAVTPMSDELFRFSSTLELAGFDGKINRKRIDANYRGVRHYLNGMHQIEVREIWRGFRPLSPDGIPYIGRSPKYKNLVFATGHGMMGITYGPITGRLITQLLNDETPEVDLQPFRPDRYG